MIVFAQAIINYVSLVINFGFNMSGARKVAVYKEDKVLLSRIVSSTYLCKLIIMAYLPCRIFIDNKFSSVFQGLLLGLCSLFLIDI